MGDGEGLFGRRMSKRAGVEIDCVSLVYRNQTPQRIAVCKCDEGGTHAIERTKSESYHRPSAHSHLSKIAFS